MSGLEVAFGVLGVLPLLISAAEHYSDCFRPFNAYRKFASECDRFQRQLKVQKTIFRTQCRILLENVVEQDAAASMLADRGHTLWADLEVDKRLAEYLREAKEACVDTIGLIEERLEHVKKESRGLSDILSEDREVGASHLRCQKRPRS